MTAVGVGPATVGERTTSREDWARWVLLGCMLVAFLGSLVLGERDSSLGHLESALQRGQVGAVYISGGMTDGAGGYDTQELHWRQGLLQYRTAVLQVGSGDHSGADHEGVTAVEHSEIGADLAARYPGLRIIREDPAGSTTSVPGFQEPLLLWLLVLGTGTGTLLLLRFGAQPRWATRWAWFWLLGCPWTWPVFLLMSGHLPLPQSWRDRLPRAPVRPWRLTGRWAFLLSFPLTALLGRLW